MIKRIYIYIAITIIFLFILSSIKQQSNDGFANSIVWYKNEYFIIPLLGTLVITGPILYFIYKNFLEPTKPGSSGA
jgi:sorbitol-specific phosphotransferase system component IIC